MVFPTVAYLLLVSVSLATSNSIHEDFLQCMASRSSSEIEASKAIHAIGSPSYSSLLQSSQQNPRWVNSTTSKPVCIITPFFEQEIQDAVLCSKKYGLQIRVRSGGHDYEGLSYLCQTLFIIVDLVNLRSITVDTVDETAWVQSGATLGELYYSIAEKSGDHGFPAGLCPSVGVGGHFSGGGIGTLMRKYGLASDNVIDAYLVDAKGRLLNRESMGEDLFWAIRGGGGASFGIIVSWKIKLVQVPPIVTVFTVDKTLQEGASELVHNWQYLADKLHEYLFIRIIVQDVKDVEKDGTTRKTVKISFNFLFLGQTNELIPLMNKSFPELGLQPENCTEMSWIESVLYFAGYPSGESLHVLTDRTMLYKSYFKAKSDFVTEPIPENGLEGIWERFLEEEIVFMIMDPLGGKMGNISEAESPFPHRKGNLYNVQYMVKWEINRVSASNKHVHWMRMLYRYMKPYVSRSPRAAYINYRDLDIGINKNDNPSFVEARIWGRKYFKDNFDRLVRVKSEADPDNFFRNHQSIPSLPAWRKRKYD